MIRDTYNHSELEPEILEFWKNQKILEKLRKQFVITLPESKLDQSLKSLKKSLALLGLLKSIKPTPSSKIFPS